jgi:hypothetical protein
MALIRRICKISRKRQNTRNSRRLETQSPAADSGRIGRPRGLASDAPEASNPQARRRRRAGGPRTEPAKSSRLGANQRGENCGEIIEA